ncbi:hypothetical protein DMUE_1751 [Dictyocoela muelleri]|nr:hypothetical protein DMUE_1751 [Dictyocoela muelleri]
MNSKENHITKESQVNKFIDYIFLNRLRIIGFKSISQKTLTAFREFFKYYFIFKLKQIKGVSQHALRNKISVTDIFNCVGVFDFSLYKKIETDQFIQNREYVEDLNDIGIKDENNFKKYEYKFLNKDEYKVFNPDKILNKDEYKVFNPDKILNKDEYKFVDNIKDVNNYEDLKDNNRDLNTTVDQNTVLKYENVIFKPDNDPRRRDDFFHVYEFMPQFPDSHTYKKTFPKDKIDNQIKRIKMRRDQSLSVEDNLFSILKNKEEIKNFLNFMFQ